MKNLSTKKGTIANVFTKHQEELFELINQNKFTELKSRVDALLSDKSLSNNPAILEAKEVFKKSSKNPSLYYSILMTYMTGMKVSF